MVTRRLASEDGNSFSSTINRSAVSSRVLFASLYYPVYLYLQLIWAFKCSGRLGRRYVRTLLTSVFNQQRHSEIISLANCNRMFQFHISVEIDLNIRVSNKKYDAKDFLFVWHCWAGLLNVNKVLHVFVCTPVGSSWFCTYVPTGAVNGHAHWHPRCCCTNKEPWLM